MVADGINYRIAMELVTKSALGSCELDVAYCSGIVGKYRCAGKTEHMVFLEFLGDSLVHIAKLRAVTFIENQDGMLTVNLMLRIAGDEIGKLLNGGDDDSGIRVIELLFKHRSRSVGVGRAFLKAVILFHRLIVEIFAVNYKQHLVNLIEP